MTQPLLFHLIGCGQLGRAMLSCWIKNTPHRFAVSEPQPSDELKALVASAPAHLSFHTSAADAFDAVIIAVKPQSLEDVLNVYAPVISARTLLISVAAGKRLNFYTQHLHAHQPVLRAVPNTPAQIGQAMTVCCANDDVSPQQRVMGEALMRAIGDVVWLDHEDQMDAAIAVSGSGPAYVFALCEAMAQAGVAAGLSLEMSERLARQTVAGAGGVLGHSTLAPQALRQAVTSPGGTTQAALAVMNRNDAFAALLEKAVAAAAARSREL